MKTADPFHIVKLIDIGRIDAENLTSVFFLKLDGNLRPKGVGMLYRKASAGMFQKLFINRIDAAFYGNKAAAPCRKRVHTS